MRATKQNILKRKTKKNTETTAEMKMPPGLMKYVSVDECMYGCVLVLRLRFDKALSFFLYHIHISVTILTSNPIQLRFFH